MKLRRVLLVLLLLRASTISRRTSSRAAPSPPSSIAPSTFPEDDGTHTATTSGGAFELTEASAAPAFDTEEQQNIGVYKKALPSVVNITSTAVAFDFFYGPVPQQGQGSGFILDKQGHILTNNHVIDNAPARRSHALRQAQVQGDRDCGRQEP